MAVVGISKGKGRYGNIKQALEYIKTEIKIPENARVLVKPNLVSSTVELAAVQAEAVESVIDFLQNYSLREIIVGESSPWGTEIAYENFGYKKLKEKFDIKLVDFNKISDFGLINLLDLDKNERPVKYTKIDYDYLISLALIKTHDHAMMTASIKNMMGFIKEKIYVHGGGWSTEEEYIKGAKVIHKNLTRIFQKFTPNLAIVDGYMAMEGNGPIDGTPVHTNIALASTNAIALDSVIAKIIGFEPSNVGYIHYCTLQLGKPTIEIKGYEPENLKFKLHYKIKSQLKWRD